MKHFLVKSLVARVLVSGGSRNFNRHIVTASSAAPELKLRHIYDYWPRMSSTLAPSPAEKETQQQREKTASEKKLEKTASENGNSVVSSYWGIAPRKIKREDGTKWPWNCFTPWDTYRADLSIDITKHHVPTTFGDKVAFKTVKFLNVLSHLYFKERYGCHAMMLETIAAVPGMVGGMVLHLKSLRRFQHSGGWIKALLEEAENERMHLMTMTELVKPNWHERLLIIAAQGVFFNAFFLFYMISPKVAHRFVGYLEEEAVNSYTEHLMAIESGKVENEPAPAIAIDYWRLPKDATLKDVITVIRADEAHHRDVNHFASDIQYQGKELREAPAPLGYH